MYFERNALSQIPSDVAAGSFRPNGWTGCVRSAEEKTANSTIGCETAHDAPETTLVRACSCRDPVSRSERCVDWVLARAKFACCRHAGLRSPDMTEEKPATEPDDRTAAFDRASAALLDHLPKEAILARYQAAGGKEVLSGSFPIRSPPQPW